MKVAIIGGGVSGIFASALLAQKGHEVTVFERNEKPLKKMFITGKGRCNVTNYVDSGEFLKHVRSNPKFLYAALASFDSFDTYSLFEGLKVPLKVERGNRVFPESDKSSDITSALQGYARSSGAEIRVNERVTKVIKKGENFIISSNGTDSSFERVIVATGGLSYPTTGSTGDGYTIAENFSHSIIRPVAALSALVTSDSFCYGIAGLTLKNVKLTCKQDGKVIYSDMGEVLITHHGISGPLVLTMSGYINRQNIKDLSVMVDLKPAISSEELGGRILKDFAKVINKEFKNSLTELLPKNLIPIVIERSGIRPDKQVNSVTVEERKKLVDTIKNFYFTPLKLAPIEEAIITAGGVATTEINPRTMESKLISGLYFIGEVVDVDAETGGFNIQIALSMASTLAENFF